METKKLENLKRSEIIFLYDVTDANPNGDPLDENKPRIDEETGINIVTDVRLKRTIRDYLFDFKKREIFIRAKRSADNNLKTKEELLQAYKNDPQEVIEKCIDIRLFGATMATKKASSTKDPKNKSGETKATNWNKTGPVQFSMGRSMHKVNCTYLKGTTVLPSNTDRCQGTFTEKYYLPYSLISFHGMVNPNAVRVQELRTTEEDINLMLDAMWHGTKNLSSCSKFGQVPRLLINVIYNDDNFYIGELNKYLTIESNKNDEAIRDITDVVIDITKLVAVLNTYKDKIHDIHVKNNDRANFLQNGKVITEPLIDILKAIIPIK